MLMLMLILILILIFINALIHMLSASTLSP